MARYTALTFAGGAAYAGVAGALAALLLDFIAPESFTYWLSILLLVGAVFGGMTSIWGAVAGGLFLQFWPDLAATVSRDLVYPVFGTILVLSLRFMPDGVAGMVTSRRAIRAGSGAGAPPGPGPAVRDQNSGGVWVGSCLGVRGPSLSAPPNLGSSARPSQRRR